MTASDEIIRHLTGPSLPSSQRRRWLREFAQANDWRPSDQIDEYPGTEDLANGHLFVEHGLKNSAVITFLRSPSFFDGLTFEERVRLLSLSYNNMVDWHLFPSLQGQTVVYNRTDPPAVEHFLCHTERDIWRAEKFDRLTGKRPNPNVRALDDALIQTISHWKRLLSAELSTAVGNDRISVLFNSIIFVRALEDHRKWMGDNHPQQLLELWDSGSSSLENVRECLSQALDMLQVDGMPAGTADLHASLEVFDELDKGTVSCLFRDFYRNRFAPYPYDFSLMSRQALSRIYEHYVSLLRETSSAQLKLFPDLPEEISNRALGGIYTPEFIARFFARVIKENHTPRDFRQLRAIDPACGSGIFLRMLLEMQCDPRQEVHMAEPTDDAFSNVLGVDIDEKACDAAKLSLSLLYLVLRDRLPEALDIVNDDALRFYESNRGLRSCFDVVMANPPFISWNRMDEDSRERVTSFLGRQASGRLDMYLAHLKLAFELVKPGGFVLYVLPHSFLFADNAEYLRQVIAREFVVLFVADLSEIRVFEEVGSYVILLILQRSGDHLPDNPAATIVRCRDFAGLALQEALEGRTASTEFYDIYEVSQEAFRNARWQLLPPHEATLLEKLERGADLSEFCHVREGFVSGDDEVFIVDAADVPSGEQRIYAPYLSDREMQTYSVPDQTRSVVFYPYLDGDKVDEELLRHDFPETWAYLEQNESRLKDRSPVRKGNVPWWCPTRPRIPGNMMRPKIVTPHLVMLPRFGLDLRGRYAVSRSPFIYPKPPGPEEQLLSYFLAVLNSAVVFWQISRVSHRYSSGYCMLEPKTLKAIKVPVPSGVELKKMRDVQLLVRRRLQDPADTAAEKDLDKVVADLYELTGRERVQVGVED